MPKPAQGPHLAYRPGLDGLRALAVGGVFLYHARPYFDGNGWMPGGFLGVDLFFVLSGYLITSLLLIEWEHSERIVLLRFWARRARRLIPALVVVVFSALLLSAIFSRINLGPTRRDTLSSLFYFNNWHQIVANESYFNRMGAASLLSHIWSLSVEEQFYLVWPLVLVPGLLFLGRKRLPYAVIAGIAGSAALMWILYKPFPADPSRVYYGTDTRAFLLLMGILLALVWPHVAKIRGVGLQLLQLLGVAALATTIYVFFTMPDPQFNATYFQGGDLAASVCFAVLIAAVAHPEGWLNHALGIAPLRWIGERSYGIYLWHLPIIVLTQPEVRLSWSGPWAVLGQAVIIVTAAALSYRFIEQPIRTQRLQKRLAAYGPRRRMEVVATSAAAIVAAFALLLIAPGTTSASPPPPPTTTTATTTTTTKGGGGKKHHHPPKRNKNALPKGHILALGDSVMDGCGWALDSTFGKRIHVDAVVGRQVRDTIRTLTSYRRKDAIPKIVIIQIGNNGPLYYADLHLLRHALRGVTDIVVVNVRNDTPWETESNSAITQWLRGWHIAHLADWYDASKPYMLSDGTHPWPKYCPIYARVIKDALRGTHT